MQEFQSQLEQIRTVQDPLQRNYSQLSDQYRAVQQQLLETQARYETLNTHYKEVAVSLKLFYGIKNMINYNN